MLERFYNFQITIDIGILKINIRKKINRKKKIKQIFYANDC